jgi:hypothetical protein
MLPLCQRAMQCHAVFELVPSGKQFAAGGGAGRAHLKAGKADSLIVQAIHFRRIEERMAIAGKINLALVVGEDDDDVRFCPGSQSTGSRDSGSASEDRHRK